ncbi:ABC transporter permease [Halomarina litorea]|uniref:ABC transporter permease n=1 Tax=Halomarina litorea TaxID=2961595 RepID=UPI0020C3028C|nr:ABC transporter permease [Halomarina sp. BCD28]
MATDIDDRFEDIDWDSERSAPRVGWRTGATVAVLLGVVAVLFADQHGLGPTDQLNWTVTRIDWLFSLSLALFVVHVVVPLARDRERALGYWQQLREDSLASAAAAYISVFFLLGLVGPLVLGTPVIGKKVAFQPPVLFSIDARVPYECVGPVVASRCVGTMAHPLGTTFEGKDVLLMVVMAMRITLQVGLISATIIVPVATVVGTVAGYVGGWVDDVLMYYVDVQQAIPAFLVYIVAIFLFGRSLFLIVLVFGLFSWGGVARLVRSEVLQRREELYARAARTAGASHLQVVRRHVLPNVSGTVITATTLQIPAIVLAEAALAYLRLSRSTLPSFGDIIAGGTIGAVLRWTDFVQAWWIATIPAVFLALTVLSFGVLGDALRDVLDPRQG